MRVVFMGTPEFAVPPLLAVTTGHDVVAVYTRPDAVSGRGSHRRPSPVAEAAGDMDLLVLKPTTLKDEAAVDEMRRLAPDVIVVAAYGLLLPPTVLDDARLRLSERPCIAASTLAWRCAHSSRDPCR